MIRYKDKTFEDYFIDPLTATITDKDGNVQETHLLNGRPFFKSYAVHRIQMYTAYGYKEGYDVHHIDEDKLNNSLDNLMYITRSEHMIIHNRGARRARAHCSEETRKKIRDWHTGKQHSAETKRKIGNARIGKKWYNNGIVNVIRKECPEGFIEGRTKKNEENAHKNDR